MSTSTTHLATSTTSPVQHGKELINPVEDLVFEDGNLIIHAYDLYHTRSFKVYEGLMSRHSPVIRQKIAEAKRQPGPGQGEPGMSMDPRTTSLVSAMNTMASSQIKCVMITVPEPPGAFEHFIRALHDSSFFEGPPNHASMEVVRTVLHLSTKYEVPALRRRALAHLYSAYPLTLQSWDNRKHRPTAIGTSASGSANNVNHLEELLKLLVIVSRNQYASWALPMLLYDVCKFNISTIESHQLWQIATEAHIKAKIRDGYTSQMELTKEVLSFTLSLNPPECTLGQACLMPRFEVTKNIVSWPLNDPLGVWKEGDWEMFNESVCNACLKDLKEKYAEHRERAWSQIPRIFGFVGEGQEEGDGWDTLRHSFHSVYGGVPVW